MAPDLVDRKSNRHHCAKAKQTFSSRRYSSMFRWRTASRRANSSAVIDSGFASQSSGRAPHSFRLTPVRRGGALLEHPATGLMQERISVAPQLPLEFSEVSQKWAERRRVGSERRLLDPQRPLVERYRLVRRAARRTPLCDKLQEHRYVRMVRPEREHPLLDLSTLELLEVTLAIVRGRWSRLRPDRARPGLPQASSLGPRSRAMTPGKPNTRRGRGRPSPEQSESKRASPKRAGAHRERAEGRVSGPARHNAQDDG